MTGTPLQQLFQDAASRLDGDAEVADVKAFLGILTSVACALCEEGFAAELDVRPYQYKCAPAVTGSVWANATLSLDGIGLDFTVGENSLGKTVMRGYLGEVRFLDPGPLSPGAAERPKELEKIAREISRFAMEVKAANDLFGAYSVEATSVAPIKPGLRPPAKRDIPTAQLKASLGPAGGEGG